MVVKQTKARKLSDAVKEFYPQYWGIHEYPADQCAALYKVDGTWGLFSNFAPTKVRVDGVEFRNTEQLFQMMRFNDREALTDIYQANGMTIKMKAKKWTKQGHCREDWGAIFIDAMKLCLQLKYEQNPEFKAKLEESKGLFIVEDQTSFPQKEANTWGTKLKEDKHIGPNLLGILLMDLRDNGKLEYNLPEDILDFVKLLK